MPWKRGEASQRLADHIRKIKPNVEQLEGCTIHWNELRSTPFRDTHQLDVKVVCRKCGRERWYRASYMLWSQRKQVKHNGYCRRCYNRHGDIRLQRRIAKMLSEKPPIEERESCSIYWHSIVVDPVRKKHIIKVVCKQCGNERWMQWNSMRSLDSDRLGTRGLCRPCAGILKRGANAGRCWKGGRRKTRDGYIAVYVAHDDPLHVMAGRCSYVQEHRLVMARRLGRPLESWEHVHHINGIKDDNRKENLTLVSRESHRVITVMESRLKQLEALLTLHGIPSPPWRGKNDLGSRKKMDKSRTQGDIQAP